ncbi:MAG TPA: MarR family winged helix-turn-helix transcriptional regulator [Ramlibacter sp.]|jgi:DNA-binding MarR family transcriptional regulator|nr:MarR family winged helix-turn-helix transcriptional regulator [Ramlibacter sp.]
MDPNDLRPDSPIEQFPGHLIRRLQQILLARYAAETEPFNLTPLQWATLRAAQGKPGLDQSTLARDIALDTSTVAGVVDRLEGRGLITRKPSPQDRRLRTLYITDEGTALLAQVSPVLVGVQRWLMEPLTPQEREQFWNALNKLVDRPAPGDDGSH